MKLSWGSWIAVAYTLFVLLIVFMVYMAFGEKWDLVSENYYEQELKYQEKIDSKANVAEEGIRLKLYLEGSSIKVELEGADKPLSEYKGEATFFRPSDAEGDVSFDFQSAEDLSFPVKALKKGKYLAKISWTDGEKGYYQERNIIIP